MRWAVSVVEQWKTLRRLGGECETHGKQVSWFCQFANQIFRFCELNDRLRSDSVAIRTGVGRTFRPRTLVVATGFWSAGRFGLSREAAFCYARHNESHSTSDRTPPKGHAHHRRRRHREHDGQTEGGPAAMARSSPARCRLRVPCSKVLARTLVLFGSRPTVRGFRLDGDGDVRRDCADRIALRFGRLAGVG